MKKIEKEEIIGYSASLIILLIVLFLLAHLYLRAQVEQKEEEVLLYSGGVELNHGELDWEGGTFTPSTPSEAPDIPPVITDNSEPTPAVDSLRLQADADRRREQERLDRERREAERREQQTNSLVSNAFAQGNQGGGQTGSGSSSSGGGGEAQGSGGVGGSHDLGGRGLHGSMKGSYVRPQTFSEEGIIVVEIWVNPEGKVIAADVRTKDTTISDPKMRSQAREAARKNRFAVIDQPGNQTGTITYHYRWKN